MYSASENTVAFDGFFSPTQVGSFEADPFGVDVYLYANGGASNARGSWTYTAP